MRYKGLHDSPAFRATPSEQWKELSHTLKSTESKEARYKAAEKVVALLDRSSHLSNSRLKNIEMMRRRPTNLGIVRVKQSAHQERAQVPTGPSKEQQMCDESLALLEQTRRESLRRIQTMVSFQNRGLDGPDELQDLRAAYAVVQQRRASQVRFRRRSTTHSAPRKSSNNQDHALDLPLPIPVSREESQDAPIESDGNHACAKQRPTMSAREPRAPAAPALIPVARVRSAPVTARSTMSTSSTAGIASATFQTWKYDKGDLEPTLRFMDILGTAAARLPCPVIDSVVVIPNETADPPTLVWLPSAPHSTNANGFYTRRVDLEATEAHERMDEIVQSLNQPPHVKQSSDLARVPYPMAVVKRPEVVNVDSTNDLEKYSCKSCTSTPLMLDGEIRRLLSTGLTVSRQPFVLQRFIKSKGPNAWCIRAVHRRGGKPYCFYIRNTTPFTAEEDGRYLPSSHRPETYSVDRVHNSQAWSEPKHLVQQVAAAVERYESVVFSDFVADFIQDDQGVWWLAQVKAFQIAQSKPRRGSKAFQKLAAALEAADPQPVVPRCMGSYCHVLEPGTFDASARQSILYKVIIHDRMKSERRPATRAECHKMYQVAHVCLSCAQEYAAKVAEEEMEQQRLESVVNASAAAHATSEKKVAPGQTRVEMEYAKQRDHDRRRATELLNLIKKTRGKPKSSKRRKSAPPRPSRKPQVAIPSEPTAGAPTTNDFCLCCGGSAGSCACFTATP